jgi:predicted SnoaL-like aldol condensation-catalyzing enzyme
MYSESQQNRFKPELIDIHDFSCEIYPDLRRVKVMFFLSAFQDHPHATLKIINQDDEVLTSVNIVNIFNQANEITLHLPANKNKPGPYKVHMDLFYLQEEKKMENDLEKVKILTIPIQTISDTFFIQ